MKKQLFILSIIMLSMFGMQAQSIGEYYTFTEQTYTYASFTGTEIITGESDDGEESIPLGVDFPYNGTTYNSVTVGVNGAVSFTYSDISFSNQLDGTSTNRINIIAPLWDDMYKRDADNGKIQYYRFATGTKIEWSNVSWFGTGSTVSFTLYLYDNGNIGFWYGSNNSTETRSASIGFNAGTTGTNFVSVTPGSPATLSTTTANNSISTTDYPGENKFYLFKYGPENDDCSDAIDLTVGNIDATHTVATLVGATDNDGNPYADVWFTATVPASGNITIETYQFAGSNLTNTWISYYSGTCGSTSYVEGDANSGTDNFSKLELTGLTPDDIIFLVVEKLSSSSDPLGKFEILAYEPPPVNDLCENAISLTVGNINATHTTGTLIGTTDDNGNSYVDAWYTATVPASGNITFETFQVSGSLMDDSYIRIFSGTCGTLTTITGNSGGGTGDFSKVELTGRTPGEILYVSVETNYLATPKGEFGILAYEPQPVNDLCADAIDLTVGTDFNSNSIEGTLAGSTTTGTTYSYPQVWYTVTVPSSGNITIETDQAPSSPMDDTFMRAYSGTCGSLSQITYSDNDGNGNFSKIELTERTPGEVIVIEVDKDGDYSGTLSTFMMSAYDPTVSINTLNAESISIFPNPANNFLNINSELNIETISIFDISGKEVLNMNVTSNNTEINVSNLKVGIYFIRIANSDGIYQTKFVKK